MANTFESGLYIDGEYYHVPILSCERKADYLWKYADRTEAGTHVGELIGIYFNYTLKFGEIVSFSEYNRLYNKLTEPEEYHTISMPSKDGGMFTFTAYFSQVKDSVKRSRNGRNLFRDLSVEFVSRYPTRS